MAAAGITAEEYLLLPDDGRPTELVFGRIVPRPLDTPRHGQVCGEVCFALGRYLEHHPVGRAVANNSGVVTSREPDSVRGPDLAYYSYQRVPPGPLPDGYLEAVPELVFEVRSPTDRWADVLSKVGEYLRAGVLVVVVLDEPTHTLQVYSADDLPRTLTEEDDLTLPALLADFRVPVRRFFD